jgi:hypothetical protein
MPTWLSDPSDGFYLVLFVFVVVSVTLWLRNRTRRSLMWAAVAVAVLVLVFVCDRLFESPREEAVRRVRDISDAINARNWDKFQANLSDGFEFKGKKKDEFTNIVRNGVNAFNPRRITAWEFKVPEGARPGGENELVIEFDGKAETDKPFLAHFVATFVRDPDGKWRLKTFTPYEYQRRSALDIPGLP